LWLWEIRLKKLKIGEVTQIGKECHLGCEIRKLVGDCVMLREGIFAKVLSEEFIKAGNDIVVYMLQLIFYI
jgi:MOSC domain-containing protein YiiM